MAYFTTIFAPKIGHVFSGIALPEFGDVKNDDVTSGSMSPGRKRPKNKTLGGILRDYEGIQ